MITNNCFNVRWVLFECKLLQVCVQLPTYAHNVTLPAFALRCCSNQSISPAAEFAAVGPCWDRRMDTVPFHRPVLCGQCQKRLMLFFVAQDLICSYVRKALTDNEVDYVGTWTRTREAFMMISSTLHRHHCVACPLADTRTLHAPLFCARW